MARKCLVIVFLFLAMPAFSDETQQPRRLLDFIETGMLVGMQATDGTAQLALHIYSEEEYQLAREIAKRPRPQYGLNASDLAEKYPSLKAKLERYIETLPADGEPDKLISSITVMPLPRVSFGRVASVGDDYVLVELEGNAKRRRVIPNRSIARVELDAEAGHFMRVLTN